MPGLGEARLWNRTENMRKSHILLYIALKHAHDECLRFCMFITFESHKHPLSSAYGRATQIWRAVVVELRWPWFLIEIEILGSQEEDGSSVTRTMCLSDINDVIGFAQSDERSGSSLRSVAVIESSCATGMGWTMHPVKEIWEAEEPQDPSLKTRILMKANGETCSLSIFGTPACDMKSWEKIATIP